MAERNDYIFNEFFFFILLRFVGNGMPPIESCAVEIEYAAYTQVFCRHSFVFGFNLVCT